VLGYEGKKRKDITITTTHRRLNLKCPSELEKKVRFQTRIFFVCPLRACMQCMACKKCMDITITTTHRRLDLKCPSELEKKVSVCMLGPYPH
jgi:hypothetical protein